jgi:hypothetical protein
MKITLAPFKQISFCGSWFFGEATSQDCTVLLAEKRDGTFLIRFSQNKKGSHYPSAQTNLTHILKSCQSYITYLFFFD